MLRLVVFVVPLIILLVIGIVWWAAVIAAALIGLCLSYILLSKPRNAVSSDLYAARHRDKPAPSADDEEDAAIDAAQSEAGHVPGGSSEGPEPDATRSDATRSDSTQSEVERGGTASGQKA
ncbi:DUF4229 domain-containing protein [Leifsonia shinshuensis]|nr:DUF4229 domain-containing protein [Leifsonia shinshuensis]